jgi:colanic acid/amylovoran biosynthesis glycosyltransferase
VTLPRRLTYVIGTYPQLTTTFIDREISALLERGIDVRIVSMRRPAVEPSGMQAMLATRTEYVLPANPARLLGSHVRWFVRRPLTYVRTLLFLVTRRHEHGSRLRTMAHFAMGVDVANRLRDDADVRLHAHFADRAATVALVAGRLLGCGYSLTAHANDIYLRPNLLSTKIGQSRVTITCTEHNLEYLHGRMPAGARSKLRRIYHGLELTRYVNLERAPSSPPLVVSVGQLKEKKGLRHLIEAMAMLRDAGVAVTCRIIGEGPQRGDLMEMVDRHRLTGAVELTGALPHDQVLAHYAAATVFALPCVVASDGDRDGIPNAILEAMATGLPVVSTPVSGIPEVIEPEVTGLLSPSGDARSLAEALRRLLLDQGLRTRLGREGQARVVDAFDVERNADRFLEAIDGSV